MTRLIIAVVLSVFVASSVARIFNRTELAEELNTNHNLTEGEAKTYMCIADLISSYDTNRESNGYIGLFNIDSEMCGEDSPSGDCNIKCSDLMDDDITDDVQCARKVYGDWEIGVDCVLRTVTDESSGSLASDRSYTKFERCEFMNLLVKNHNLTEAEAKDHVCIADIRSGISTNPFSHSVQTFFGLYQIGSEWWCGKDSPSGGCNIKCSDLTDHDITDDVRCAQQIYANAGGLSAWGMREDSCDYVFDDMPCLESTTTTEPAVYQFVK